MGQVIHGALAVIYHNNVQIGFMRGIRVTENFQLQDVKGIGSFFPDEIDVVGWNGSVTCDFFNIRFDTSSVPNAVIRRVNSITEWVNTVLLNTALTKIDIYKKVEDFVDPVTGIVTATEEPFAQIQEMILESEGFDINEGQISGRNQSFRYRRPITFPLGA